MKHNRFRAVALAFVMAIALAIPAFGVQGTDGTVDIEDAIAGEEYDLYRIMDLDYVAATSAYSYSIRPAYQKFFDENVIIAFNNGEEKEYTDDEKLALKYTVGSTEYPAYTTTDSDQTPHATPNAVVYCINTHYANNLSQIANKLAQYVETEGLSRDYFVKCNISGSAKINGLLYGYYLMKPMGPHNSALFSLNTVTSSATIENKSQYPTPIKTVKDKDETEYGKTNIAAIGETVSFKITGTTPSMAAYSTYEFIITDNMPNFTYEEGSAVLKIGGVEIPITESEDGTGSNPLVWNSTQKTLTLTIPNLKTITSATENATIEFTYNATVNNVPSLVIGGAGNVNTAKFTFSNDPNSASSKNTSVSSKTTTFVLQFKLEKVNVSGVPLKGATWKLEKKVDNAWVDVSQLSNGKPVFATESTGTYQYNGETTATTNGDGVFVWSGIDKGRYRLTEMSPPEGYVQISNPIEFNIDAVGNLTETASEGNLSAMTLSLASTSGHPSVRNHGATASTGLGYLKVQNITQTELPSTGGAGLYVIAGVAIVALLGFGGTAILKRKVNGGE